MAGGVSVEQKKKGKRAAGGVLRLVDRYKYVLLVVLAGVICLAWPSGGGEEPAEPVQAESGAETSRAAMESELADILGKIQGVGQIQVMLTLDRGREQVLAEDTSLSYSGQTMAPDDYSRSSETVVVSQKGGGDQVVVRQEIWPSYRGALVVCEGGEDPQICLAVISAVSALTGLGADRISVVKWQS